MSAHLKQVSLRSVVKPAQLLSLLLGAVALLTLGAPAAAWATDHKPAACEDHTPHKIRMVKVAPGVELEVLDWGGKGKAMVLLTGLRRQCARLRSVRVPVHRLLSRHRHHPARISALEPASERLRRSDQGRRRHRGARRLGHRQGGVRRAFAAGAELSELGQAHRARVDKLVYLDAADLSERFLPSRREPPAPVYTDADLKSLWAFQAATARLQAPREPDQSVCLRLKFDANGAIVDSTSPDWITNKIARASQRIRRRTGQASRRRGSASSPYSPLEARQAWYWYLSPAKKAEFDEAWGPIVDWHRRTIGKFEEGNSANTFLLPGAPHYVYINNEAEVVRWMRKFLGIPPRN